MSAISPFKSPQRLSELRTGPALGEDALSDVLLVSPLDSKYWRVFLDAVPDLSTFVTLTEQLLDELYKDICSRYKDAPFAKSAFLRRSHIQRFLRLIRYIVLGGSVAAQPTTTEVETYIASMDQGLLGVNLFSPQSSVTSPITSLSYKDRPDGSKLSEALTMWDGGNTSWFDWKDATWIKMGQFPDFKAVLEDENKATADTARSSILYSIFLEKTSGGDAHTLLTALPLAERTGYHAWTKLKAAMEGAEKGPLLEKEANRLLKVRKDIKTTLLSFQGDMERAFQLLIHA